MSTTPKQQMAISKTFNENMEKVARVQSLVENGWDLTEAVNYVGLPMNVVRALGNMDEVLENKEE